MWRDKKLVAGLLVTVVALALLAALDLDWARLWQALRGGRYEWLALALPLYLVGYWSRAKRVAQIMRPAKAVETGRVLPALVIGFACNNILPARLGEFVFAYLLGKREGVSRTAALAAVVLSRILDGITILAFFLFGLFAFLSVSQGEGQPAVIELAGVSFTREALIGKVYYAGILGAIFFGLVSVTCFLLIAWKEFTLGLVDKMLFFFPRSFTDKGKLALEKFIAGLQIMHDPKALLGVFLFNFVPWGLELFTYYFTGRVFGLDLTIRQCALIMGMTNLAMTVPSGPGGIGLFEWGGLLVMALMGLEKTVAFTYILTVHALILLPINLWGLYYLWKEGISVGEALSGGAGEKRGRHG